MKKSWGKHLIIDACGIDRERLENWQAILKLLRDLPKKLNMRALCRPFVAKVASDKYHDWGISGFIMLYESHISLHTWPEQGYAAMDVYSCKDFNEKAIIRYFKKFWEAKKIKVKLVIRG